ncbi:MAG TPA: endopeptidase La [Eubacteriales bacterium]|nr:endopeptidase La [Eubacteriales bacterium]
MNKEPTTLPMIALRGMVIFPDTTISLDIGRKKSLNALDKAVKDQSLLFVAAQKDLATVDPTQKDIHTVGTVVRILQVMKLSAENARAIIRGLYSAKIDEFIPNEENLEVKVHEVDYIEADKLETEAMLRKSRDLVAQLGLNSNKITKDSLIRVAEIYDPNVYVNVVANEVVYREAEKQELLQTVDTEKRLEKLAKILINEVELAKIDKKIAGRVKRQIDKGQKEFYLKEQIRAISQELGNDEDEISELEKLVQKSKMPEDVAAKAMKEIRRMSKMVSSSPDASVIRAYVEWLTDMPWSVLTKDNKDLVLARKILDEDHFGLDKIKQRIIEYLAVMQLTGGLNGPILCFVGPPGTGKTSIVKSIARALDRKYVRMSLGGVRDEAEIRGHRRTYVGAIPGKIIYLMKQAQSMNPVMLFDEIDKMSSDFRGDPASAMLEVLDPEQNSNFVDHYMEVSFDLSKTLFICTANNVDNIPPALLDRMELIELTGYTEEEKMEIAKSFLVPKQEKLNGIEPKSVAFTEDALRTVIKSYTRESGVRQLEREIATVCRKIALEVVNEKVTDITITQENVEKYLDIPKYKNETVDKKDEIGSATGLAWTVVGGTTLIIDVTLFEGKGEILLTGKLGDVMKESARAAISLVRSKASDYGIDPEKFLKTDIHIHIPEGAIPKDGPSAGVTMATAIMSAFSGYPVRKNVAMTGEVTLRGKVLPIGGLKEKTLAAYRAGIRKIIVPIDNEKDLREIPKEVLLNMEVVLAENIKTVFDNALNMKK